MPFIGIDLGTSFIKGAVLHPDTWRLEHVQRVPFPAPLAATGPFECEFDPREVVAATRDVIERLSHHAPHCEGIVMCSQMHGVVLMDGRGEARSNCVSWRDQRAAAPHLSGAGSYYEILLRRLNSQSIQQTGNELEAGRPVCFLFWLAEQGKLAPRLIPASIPDYVLSVLCGTPPATEITNAAAHGALNLATGGWHHEAIEEMGLGSLRWPVIRKHGEVVGEFSVGGARVPCYTPIGDYQCALLGALLGPEEISLNISTGSQVSRLTNSLTPGDYQTRPFFDGKFLNTFTGAPAGRSLNVLVDLVGDLAKTQGVALEDPWISIAEAAVAVTDTDLEVNLSFFPNPRGERGEISNIRGNNLTLGHLFRAAFKNMADTYYDCAQRLWPERAWNNLVFSGGLATKLPVLREIIRERFQTPSRLTPFEEDTLFGLMILAAVFSERAPSIEALTSQLRARFTDASGG